MRFDYSWLRGVLDPATALRGLLTSGPKRLMVGLGLMILPVSAFMQHPERIPVTPVAPEKPKHDVPKPADPRIERLRAFFSRLHCPVTKNAPDFVHAADENHLDWRLLPSISFVESGGGKACRNNNIFGWGNGNQNFSSVGSGIREVAYKLARSPLYRGHDSAGKLRIYNSDSHYAENVLEVMNRIAPTSKAVFAVEAN